MNACRDLYSACLKDGRDFGVVVDEAFPGGECEHMPISAFSPGCVHALEKLTRLVIHPIHVNNGVPVSIVFNDAWNSDLSLFREAGATDAEIQLALAENRATGKARSQDRSFFGVMHALADAIRPKMPEHTDAAESSRLPPKAPRPQPRAPRRYSDPYAVEYSLVVEAGLICPTSSRVTALFNLTRRPQARRTRALVL